MKLKSLYVVRGHDCRIGRRVSLSNPMSKSRDEKFKKKINIEMGIATPTNQWVKNVTIKKD